jgi:hypothetical protein
MPKVSFATKDAVETSLNFGEGWGEIVEIRSVVHQFPDNKTTGESYDAATNIEMKIQRTTPDGKHTNDDPVVEFFGCGALEKFHPGRVDNADDEDVEDQGDEIGADGNCLWSDGSAINKRSKWYKFLESLEAAGFKPDVLVKGFLPDLVRLKGFFHSVKQPKDADRVYKRDPVVLCVKQITKFPYDKASTKGAGKAKDAAAPAATGKGKTSAATASAPAAEANEEISVLSLQIMQELAKKNAGQAIDKAKIPGKLFTILAKGVNGSGPVPTEHHKPVMDMFKNDEWLGEACGDLEFEFADGKIVFPKAA